MILLKQMHEKFDGIWLEEAGKKELVGYVYRIPPFAVSCFTGISQSQCKQIEHLAAERECEAERDPEAERPIAVIGGLE